jgi:hypothetical protein
MVAADVFHKTKQEIDEHAKSTSTGRLIGRDHFPYKILAAQTKVVGRAGNNTMNKENHMNHTTVKNVRN